MEQVVGTGLWGWMVLLQCNISKGPQRDSVSYIYIVLTTLQKHWILQFPQCNSVIPLIKPFVPGAHPGALACDPSWYQKFQWRIRTKEKQWWCHYDIIWQNGLHSAFLVECPFTFLNVGCWFQVRARRPIFHSESQRLHSPAAATLHP